VIAIHELRETKGVSSAEEYPGSNAGKQATAGVARDRFNYPDDLEQPMLRGGHVQYELSGPRLSFKTGVARS